MRLAPIRSRYAGLIGARLAVAWPGIRQRTNDPYGAAQSAGQAPGSPPEPTPACDRARLGRSSEAPRKRGPQATTVVVGSRYRPGIGPGRKEKGVSMADRMLFVGWGASVPGREERGLEVFNEAIGLYGRLQQDGRIEKFDVVLLDPNPGLSGYIELHGSADQLNAVRQSEEFRRTLADASLIVEDIRLVEGFTNDGVAREMALYQESIARVPQTT